MHRKPFETDIANDGAHLIGPWRSPRQMLAEQVYDDHVSIHDDATAKRLGFQGGAIEGSNSLQPIRAARRAALGRGVVRDGLLVGALSQPRLRGRRRAGGHGQAAPEPRATHRKPKRRYTKRVRMPSKLDRHLATIETWLAAEPQLTALAIVGRLVARDPETFGPKQHSIVQRLLQALRTRAAEKLLVSTGLSIATTENHMPGPVDGSGYEGPDPPTGPLLEQAFTSKDNVPSLPVR